MTVHFAVTTLSSASNCQAALDERNFKEDLRRRYKLMIAASSTDGLIVEARWKIWVGE